MKNTSLILIAAATIAASAQAQQEFVTGFNFNDIDEQNNVGDRTANFGGTATAGSPERGFFTLYTENSAFASDTDPYNGMVANAGSGWWQAREDLGGGFGEAGLAGVHTIRGSQPQFGANPPGFTRGNVNDAGNALHVTGAINGGFFSFGIDGSSSGFSMIQDLQFGFQARASSAFAVEQSWFLMSPENAGDIGSGNFSNALRSGSFTPGSDYAEWELNLGDVLSGSYLVFGISTTETDSFSTDPAKGIYYDNVTFTGTGVIPEPSTYAAFAGLAALGIAFWHRSRKART